MTSIIKAAGVAALITTLSVGHVAAQSSFAERKAYKECRKAIRANLDLFFNTTDEQRSEYCWAFAKK